MTSQDLQLLVMQLAYMSAGCGFLGALLWSLMASAMRLAYQSDWLADLRDRQYVRTLNARTHRSAAAFDRSLSVRNRCQSGVIDRSMLLFLGVVVLSALAACAAPVEYHPWGIGASVWWDEVRKGW